jgi:hypothetical protein
MRRDDLVDPKRSIRAVVGTPSIALAMKAPSEGAATSGGRPAPGAFGNEGFEADQVVGRHQAPERFGHRVNCLAKPMR